jgi:hypothetical protein
MSDRPVQPIEFVDQGTQRKSAWTRESRTVHERSIVEIAASELQHLVAKGDKCGKMLTLLDVDLRERILKE